ncbi:uncharacterized protein PGTG_06570 [Puccinia graminis f. sp. tritici CRL 75-36-700-3]|uniref:Sfi1 spindle body domain-containing protein n=1 Tax=Puccinia graminis f. sp. tritici (strain CRL 75-36-700-3 / race SCCL) TaxID=418459 RepID=E3K8K5_PUCGT|nr:uncharacterized protein PGTG_06570 [Puccinia graminis f. sp. tritici CRL 75-36-700-3]EFP80614.2 hypothetical protein PGTG_06570 [Puccinia graminis f. sp. tritici CRL 75-36-700-3]
MPFNFSLASTATSDASARTPHGSFPFLTGTDAKFISDIIQRTPRNTPTFSTLLTGFNELLDEQQLDPQSREKYYSLLLKLSLVAGQDWHERWARVCASQGLEPRENETTHNLLQLSPPSNSQDGLDSSMEDASRTIRANPLHTHPDSPPLQSPTSTRLTLPRMTYRQQTQSTPNKLTRFTPSRVNSASTISTADSTEDTGLDLGSRFVDPLDALSDRVRREALLQLGFHTWKHLSNYWLMANKEADLGRGRLVVGYAWRKWRSRFGKRQREIRMVDSVAKTRSKSAILIRWRAATTEKQRIRRKNYENQAINQVQNLMNRNLSVQIFTKWTLLTKLSITQKHRDSNLKSLVLNQWADQFSRICRMTKLADRHHGDVNVNNSLRRMVAHWRWKSDLVLKEFHIVQVSDQHLQIEVLAQWRQLAISFRLAHDFWVRTAQRRWIRVWAYRRYRLKERGRLLGRILLTRFLKNAFGSWLTRFNRIRHYLDAKRQVFQKKLAKRLQVKILKAWRERYLQKSIQLTGHAVDRYRISLVARHLNRWMIVYSRIQDLNKRTYSEWRMDRLKRVWALWSARLQRARMHRLVRIRKRKMLKNRFHDWVVLTRQRKEDQRLCMIFENRVDPIRKLCVIRIWVKRVIDLKERTLQVDRNYANRVRSIYIDVWVTRILDIRRLNELANGFAEIQKIELRSRLLDFWRNTVSDSRRRSAILAGWCESRDKKTIRSTWIHWSDKNIQQSLKFHEDQTREMIDDRLREQSLQIWLTKTQTLPALRFNRQRLKIRCLSHWSQLTEVRHLRRIAVSRDRKVVLCEAFKVWWGKCAAIKASRIVSRFSRPSAFSGGNRQRTRSSHQLPELSRQNLVELLSNPSSRPVSSPGRRLMDLPVPPRRRVRDVPQMYDSTTSGEESGAPHTPQIFPRRPDGEPLRNGGRRVDTMATENRYHHEETDDTEEQDTEEQEQEWQEAVEEELESQEEFEEDQTILGDASEMVVGEEPSTTETEALTEAEIDRMIRRRLGPRRFGPGSATTTRTPITQALESDSNAESVDSRLPIGSSRITHSRQLLNPPSSAPSRARQNQVLIGLRNLDLRRRQ